MSQPLTNISLLQMRAFLAVSEYGSFTQAAQALHRTQPAVTMQVKQLEETLGLKLLDRSTRRLRLTAAGRDLTPAISALLQQLDAMVESSRDIVEKRGGIIRIACLPSTTIAASGYADYDVSLGLGIFAPKGTPDALINKLRRDINLALKDESLQKQFAMEGVEPTTRTPAEFKATLRKDIQEKEALMKKLNITLQ